MAEPSVQKPTGNFSLLFVVDHVRFVIGRKIDLAYFFHLNMIYMENSSPKFITFPKHKLHVGLTYKYRPIHLSPKTAIARYLSAHLSAVV